MDQLIVAPVMTDLNAGGGGDDYAKAPKGNLDITGRYFILDHEHLQSSL
jgi:hypothetical protein